MFQKIVVVSPGSNKNKQKVNLLLMSDEDAIKHYRIQAEHLLGFKINATDEEILETINRDRENILSSKQKER